MTGRPSKINTRVTIADHDHKKREVSMTDAFVELLEAGCYIGHICQAVGIHESTLGHWRARGREWLDDTGNRKVDDKEIPEAEIPFVEFVERTVVAEGVGITWHELNIARGAATDPRLSLYFLERRRPEQYGRRVKIQTEEERTPAPFNVETAKQARESFEAAHIPDGFDPADVLPELTGE